MMEELGVMEQSVLNIRLIILQRLFGELKEEELYKAFNLIRCHNKRLSKIGDFSCPLDLQIWQRVLPTIQIPDSLNISIEISGIDGKIEEVEQHAANYGYVAVNRDKVDLSRLLSNIEVSIQILYYPSYSLLH